MNLLQYFSYLLLGLLVFGVLYGVYLLFCFFNYLAEKKLEKNDKKANISTSESTGKVTNKEFEKDPYKLIVYNREQMEKLHPAMLRKLVKTREVVGHKDDGDNWDIPIYNMPQRVLSAEYLAKTKDEKSLPTLIEFFNETAFSMSTGKDFDNTGFHTGAYPYDLRRIGKSIISFVGKERFNDILTEETIPYFFDKASEFKFPHTRETALKYMSERDKNIFKTQKHYEVHCSNLNYYRKKLEESFVSECKNILYLAKEYGCIDQFANVLREKLDDEDIIKKTLAEISLDYLKQ